MPDLIIIGGGLAGTEAAWQAAERGVQVTLYEMRPTRQTGAHTTSHLAELVCSNSLGSKMPDRASGLLKNELRAIGSLLVRAAEENAVPAGNSLSVDRLGFSEYVTQKIESHPSINLIRKEITEIPDSISVIATGPLTSDSLSAQIEKLSGKNNLFFYDAISPVVLAETINMDIAFRASRYGKGELENGDYINCPFTKEEYDQFVLDLIAAERIELKPFEANLLTGVNAGAGSYFEGCLPVEVLASRGKDALAFGPMRPVGLRDPKTGQRPYAVVQLRQDNLAGTLFNLVGFQTNLTFKEQRNLFQKIPGLKNAEFVRLGQMHRNTFIAAPLLLNASMQFRNNPNLFFAGQITGIEGYMGNIASGMVAGINAARRMHNQEPLLFPETTIIGSLCRYISNAAISDFQPMKANFGILPALTVPIRNKGQRYNAYANRSLTDLETFIHLHSLSII